MPGQGARGTKKAAGGSLRQKKVRAGQLGGRTRRGIQLGRLMGGET